MRKGPHHAKHDFFVVLKIATIPRPQSPQLSTWFVGSLGLLHNIYRFKVRSYSTPPVLSDEPPKRGIKMTIFECN